MVGTTVYVLSLLPHILLAQKQETSSQAHNRNSSRFEDIPIDDNHHWGKRYAWDLIGVGGQRNLPG